MSWRGRSWWRTLVVRAVVSLALGVVVTVGIAWGSAIVSTKAEPKFYYWQFPLADLRVAERHAGLAVRRMWTWGAPSQHGEIVPFLEVPASSYDSVYTEMEPPSRTWGSLAHLEGSAGRWWSIEEAHGWPWLAMYWSIDYQENEKPWPRTFKADGGIPLPTYGATVNEATFRALPLKFIWSGLVANTALFAAAILVLWCVLAAARRAWRRRHGRCAACRYDLRGLASNTCPECGAATSEAGSHATV